MFTPTRISRWPVVLFAALLLGRASAHAEVPDSGASAEQVMAQLSSEAAATHRNILLSFGASWCGNCRLFERFVSDPTIHPILEKAFVFSDLDTGERPEDKKHSNIPGGQKLEASLGGKGAGYPYIVMLDPRGNMITNSLRPVSAGKSENTGNPDAPYEVDWFMEMLKKGAPSLSAQETATIRNWLTNHSSSRH